MTSIASTNAEIGETSSLKLNRFHYARSYRRRRTIRRILMCLIEFEIIELSNADHRPSNLNMILGLVRLNPGPLPP